MRDTLVLRERGDHRLKARVNSGALRAAGRLTSHPRTASLQRWKMESCPRAAELRSGPRFVIPPVTALQSFPALLLSLWDGIACEPSADSPDQHVCTAGSSLDPRAQASLAPPADPLPLRADGSRTCAAEYAVSPAWRSRRAAPPA